MAKLHGSYQEQRHRNMWNQMSGLDSRSGNGKAKCSRLGAKLTLAELRDLAHTMGILPGSTLPDPILAPQVLLINNPEPPPPTKNCSQAS